MPDLGFTAGELNCTQTTAASAATTCTPRSWQQYLHKVPHGYRCHANTDVKFPTLT
ncbi:hypothetical protein GCM10022215_14850 [Nocardioides fonticola]|uniref:Uncharacterized protein n=1 Tax=Nocardioides fonticola TaxID=450363 RepID=A0ABP7XGI9_9ACTN